MRGAVRLCSTSWSGRMYHVCTRELPAQLAHDGACIMSPAGIISACLAFWRRRVPGPFLSTTNHAHRKRHYQASDNRPSRGDVSAKISAPRHRDSFCLVVSSSRRLSLCLCLLVSPNSGPRKPRQRATRQLYRPGADDCPTCGVPNWSGPAQGRCGSTTTTTPALLAQHKAAATTTQVASSSLAVQHPPRHQLANFSHPDPRRRLYGPSFCFSRRDARSVQPYSALPRASHKHAFGRAK